MYSRSTLRYPRAVAANEPATREHGPAPGASLLRRLRWAFAAAILLLGAVAAAIALRPSSGPPATVAAAAASGAPAATWAAGEKRAPGFRLTDEHGKPVTMAGLRGRRVIVTFVDPHCTTFCPRESLVLNDALRTFPQAERPAVVAVSVDPKTRSPAVLRKEARRFKWLPQWRWAAGSASQLGPVWAAYHIQVVPAADDIGHTEAAYLVDASGHERALFLWPFKAADVAAALKRFS
jgi:cytochrome oxidase Cu insertion factor (SCO1/SenC/PrrC family)